MTDLHEPGDGSPEALKDWLAAVGALNDDDVELRAQAARVGTPSEPAPGRTGEAHATVSSPVPDRRDRGRGSSATTRG